MKEEKIKKHVKILESAFWYYWLKKMIIKKRLCNDLINNETYWWNKRVNGDIKN